MFWKKERNIVVALEIGSSKIAAAVGEIHEDGSLALLAVGEAPSSYVRKSEIVELQTASQCVMDALKDAEEKTDIEIKDVYLALSGAHIRSRNYRVSIQLEGDEHVVTADHLNILQEQAKEVPLPADQCLLHAVRQNYYLDEGAPPTANPLGLSTTKLFADFHIIYGHGARLKNTVSGVHCLGIEVPYFAQSSYATAQAVLDQEDKELGTVVITCGAGVTEYIVYEQGNIIYTGVLGVGGDHMTHDIAMGLRIPFAKAEDLKKREGSVILREGERDETIVLTGTYEAAATTIRRESLNTIMHARQEETLEIIRNELSAQPFWEHFAGTIYFTGGGSQMRGLIPLAESIFPHPCRPARFCGIDGDQTYASRPDLSTVLGLLRYAQRNENENASVRGWARVGHSIRNLLTSVRLFTF